MDPKWRVVRSETLLKDRWINLRADQCVTPAGTDVSPYYVLSYPDWVHVIAITTDERLVLVRQYRHAVAESVLELPGGAVDAEDADLERSARRELEEETGFTSDRWDFVTSLYPSPATHTNRVHFFVAYDAVCTHQQRLDASEDGLTVTLLDIPTVLAGLRTGILGHATNVSGLLLGLAVAQRLNLSAGRP